MDKELAKSLPDCKGVSFAADYWTSRNQDPYLGMTMNWVDKDFTMRKMLVACRSAEGRHTGANIAGHIDKIVGGISGLKGSTTRFCVTDNAANMPSFHVIYVVLTGIFGNNVSFRYIFGKKHLYRYIFGNYFR